MKRYPSHKGKYLSGSCAFDYELIRQDRKTLSLTVTPNLKVILKTPTSFDETKIESFLTRKCKWVRKQLVYFRKYQNKKYQKEYVSGENYYYLGKQYTLVVKSTDKQEVMLGRKILHVNTTYASNTAQHTEIIISQWFYSHAITVLTKRFEIIKSKFGYSHDIQLSFRHMKDKWGVYNNKNSIVLNPKLIHTALSCIDYVITHELNHIKHRKHDKNFLQAMNTLIPTWRKVKEKLDEQGSQMTY